MGGIELRNQTLVVEREPNQLDELARRFSDLLKQFDIQHVYIAGYVSILAGRARSTEGVDVLIERSDEKTADELAATLDKAGVWEPALPLTSMYEMLDTGDNIWVAPDDQITPQLEVKFVRDEFDRASLENAITATIGGEAIPIGPVELQIAYKPHLSARTDIEDAVHLYALFEGRLRVSRLETWVRRRDVEPEYDATQTRVSASTRSTTAPASSASRASSGGSNTSPRSRRKRGGHTRTRASTTSWMRPSASGRPRPIGNTPRTRPPRSSP